IYNTLCLHGLVEWDPPSSMSQKYEFLKKAKYRIGEESFSLLEIEHAVLRAGLPKVSSIGTLKIFCSVFFNFIFAAGSGLVRMKLPRFTKQDPRINCAVIQPEPMVNFVLYSCTQSSPPIMVYTPVNLRAKVLEVAHEFLTRDAELIGCDSYDTKQYIVIRMHE